MTTSLPIGSQSQALPLDGGGLGGGEVFGVSENRRRGAAPFEHDAHRPGALKRARRLRQNMPASEARLWAALRKLKLGVRRQAPIGAYIVDFVHHGARLVLEVDGGRHDLPEAQLHDAERDAWLVSQGYRVLRIRDHVAFGRPFDVAERFAPLVRERTGKVEAPDVTALDVSDTPPSQPFPHRGGRA
ncbi:MAG: endonuclease domain-containing protein [Pseudomonadota bacterium]